MVAVDYWRQLIIGLVRSERDLRQLRFCCILIRGTFVTRQQTRVRKKERKEERRTEGQPLVTDFLSVRWCVRLSDPVYRQPFGAYETGQLGFASIFTQYGWPLGPVEFKSNCRPF